MTTIQQRRLRATVRAGLAVLVIAIGIGLGYLVVWCIESWR